MNDMSGGWVDKLIQTLTKEYFIECHNVTQSY